MACDLYCCRFGRFPLVAPIAALKLVNHGISVTLLKFRTLPIQTSHFLYFSYTEVDICTSLLMLLSMNTAFIKHCLISHFLKTFHSCNALGR